MRLVGLLGQLCCVPAYAYVLFSICQQLNIGTLVRKANFNQAKKNETLSCHLNW